MGNVKGSIRKTTSQLQLTGALDHNPQRYAGRDSEPKPTEALGSVPSSLTPPQKKIWRELASQAAPGVLFSSDRVVLEMLCVLVEKMRAGKLKGIELGHLLSSLQQIGFTPVSRSRIAVPQKPKSKEDWGALLKPTGPPPLLPATCTPNDPDHPHTKSS